LSRNPKTEIKKRLKERVLEMNGKRTRQREGTPTSILGYIAKGLLDFGKYVLFDSYNSNFAQDYSYLELEKPSPEELEKQLVNRANIKEASNETLKKILGKNAAVILGAKYDGSDELLVHENPYDVLPKPVKYLLEKSKVSKRAIQDSTAAHEYAHNFVKNEVEAEKIGIQLLKYIHQNSGNRTARKLARNALIASSIINRFYEHNPFNEEVGLDIGRIGAEPELEAA